MKHIIEIFLSVAVFGQTLGVLADDAVECYALDAVNEVTYTYNTYGFCSSHCEDAGSSVFAVQGPRCYCLDTLPSNDKKVDESNCNVDCPGYALQKCGGLAGNYSVGTIEGFGGDSSSPASSSVTTTGTATATIVSEGTASRISLPTTPATASIASSSSTPSNSTVTATPSSTSGSSGSASPTVASSSTGAPIFKKGATVVASVLSAVAAFFALV